MPPLSSKEANGMTHTAVEEKGTSKSNDNSKIHNSKQSVGKSGYTPHLINDDVNFSLLQVLWCAEERSLLVEGAYS